MESGVRVNASFQKIPHLVGRIGSGMRVSASFQIFSSGNLRGVYLQAGLHHGLGRKSRLKITLEHSCICSGPGMFLSLAREKSPESFHF